MKSNEDTDKGRALLEVRDLSVSFTKKQGMIRKKSSVVNAVDKVSFEIKESEIFSLVGESGSGKTTIAKCILKLVYPTSGSLMYQGGDISGLSHESLVRYRRDVQMIYQDPFESLNPRQDVFTIISTPVKLLLEERDPERVRDIVDKLLADVGLREDVSSRFPHQLSGGQRQRVNIARALATNPKLLVADEPITMLDASQRLGVLSLLTRLKKQRGMTILLITHDLASAKIMSDRMAVMYSGRLMEIGESGRVLTQPLHPYTELILSSTPSRRFSTDLPERTGAFSGEEEVITAGCRFASRCKYATDLCRQTEPDLVERSIRHYASCHFPLNSASADVVTSAQ